MIIIVMVVLQLLVEAAGGVGEGVTVLLIPMLVEEVAE